MQKRLYFFQYNRDFACFFIKVLEQTPDNNLSHKSFRDVYRDIKLSHLYPNVNNFCYIFNVM